MENEKRLIDANTLKAKAFADPDSGEAMVYLQDIDEARTVDAVEVVHGRWLTWEEQFPGEKPRRSNNLGVFCDKCHNHADNRTDFCPNCGAKMDVGDWDG